MKPLPSFYLPLLHTLVEERAGERRILFRWRFMESEEGEGSGCRVDFQIL
jgi:hypothetical protein